MVSFLFCDPGFLIYLIIVILAAHIVVITLNFCAWGRRHAKFKSHVIHVGVCKY